MVTEDQSPVISFLAQPSTHGGTAVERVDSHASVVFLVGKRALKLKRAVRYDYLDFSTLERRRVLCELEVHLNRRTAPMLYRGVMAVTREADGALALGGSGEPVEWLVEMNRFDQTMLFDRLAERGELALELMPRLGHAIAGFHRVAAPRLDRGGKAGMKWVIDGNEDTFRQQSAVLDPGLAATITSEARAALERTGSQLDARRLAGLVRQCHGDLHLRNIVLLDGHPTLFDAVEFNDDISCIDVLYDLAFLLMDLWRRDRKRHAHSIFNSYTGTRGEYAGTALLPLFLSCRAAVRAKTSATAAGLQPDGRKRRELEDLGREYLQDALELLRPCAPSLIAVGGLSGSGKSTLAMAFAPEIGAVPGALVIRSDELRKRMAGVPALTPLGPEGYAPEFSSRVYSALFEHAAATVRAGHTAIVDAVFARAEDRVAVEGVAAEAGVPFTGLWMDAPEDVLIERARRRSHDASDADAEVIRMQLAQNLGTIDWRRINAARDSEVVLNEVRGLVSGLTGSREAR